LDVAIVFVARDQDRAHDVVDLDCSANARPSGRPEHRGVSAFNAVIAVGIALSGSTLSASASANVFTAQRSTPRAVAAGGGDDGAVLALGESGRNRERE
jgi:hypothetical protein